MTLQYDRQLKIIEELKHQLCKQSDESISEDLYKSLLPAMDNIKLNFEYPGLKLDKRQISELLFSVTRKDLDKCMSYSPKVLKLTKKKITKYFNNARDNFSKKINSIMMNGRNWSIGNTGTCAHRKDY